MATVGDKLSEEKTIRYLVILVLLLIFFGVVMVYSSSFIYAKEAFNNSRYFFVRQLLFALLGPLAIFLASKLSFNFIYKHGMKIGIFVIVLLLLTFIPGVGMQVKGAHRWLSVGGFNLQPGEFSKYLLLFPTIYLFENFYSMKLSERVNLLLVVAAPLGILTLQPDFGMFAVCLLVIAFICLMSSFPRKILYSFLFSGVVAGAFLIFMAPYRMQRILTFLDPWKDPQKSGFQIIQSYLALANGGIFGKGLANGDEKLLYLPEAHNDFIFSVVGEELGFIGIFILVVAFIILAYFGFKLAIRAQNRVVMIFISAVTFILALQAFLNMGVVLGLLPTKGLNLPFISYGGSSLISNCLAIGLVISAFKMNLKEIRDREELASEKFTDQEKKNEVKKETEEKKEELHDNETAIATTNTIIVEEFK
ncbi:MAG: putative lipid II flippase FtsW [Oligoflexia bacterium]|nr:putative lipid II flippase FtsW [Oligoflexia bacterium]MBF0364803.1 putative lipid II flippase FtsW [Oligoflexia bacterium]